MNIIKKKRDFHQRIIIVKKQNEMKFLNLKIHFTEIKN